MNQLDFITSFFLEKVNYILKYSFHIKVKMPFDSACSALCDDVFEFTFIKKLKVFL
jgi:hypothetical protein